MLCFVVILLETQTAKWWVLCHKGGVVTGRQLKFGNWRGLLSVELVNAMLLHITCCNSK